jgi:hypothetical protein
MIISKERKRLLFEGSLSDENFWQIASMLDIESELFEVLEVGRTNSALKYK